MTSPLKGKFTVNNKHCAKYMPNYDTLQVILYMLILLKLMNKSIPCNDNENKTESRIASAIF